MIDVVRSAGRGEVEAVETAEDATATAIAPRRDTRAKLRRLLDGHRRAATR